MKIKMMLLLFFVTAFISTIYSQPRFNPEKQVERLADELNLTSDQQTKVLSILNDSRKEMESKRENMNGDREEMMDKMREHRAEIDKKIEAVLTEDQAVKYRALQEERRKQFENGRIGKGQR